MEELQAQLTAVTAERDTLKAENEALKASAAQQKTASEVAEAMQKRIAEVEKERDLKGAEVEDLRKTIHQLLNGGVHKAHDKDGFMKSLNI